MRLMICGRLPEGVPSAGGNGCPSGNMHVVRHRVCEMLVQDIQETFLYTARSLNTFFPSLPQEVM